MGIIYRGLFTGRVKGGIGLERRIGVFKVGKEFRMVQDVRKVVTSLIEVIEPP